MLKFKIMIVMHYFLTKSPLKASGVDKALVDAAKI